MQYMKEVHAKPIKNKHQEQILDIGARLASPIETTGSKRCIFMSRNPLVKIFTLSTQSDHCTELELWFSPVTNPSKYLP